MTDEDLERIRNALFAGRKIEAIKIYRESTGQGLKQAKDAVELLEDELRKAEPEKFTAPPAKGCALVLFAFLGIVGAIVGMA